MPQIILEQAGDTVAVRLPEALAEKYGLRPGDKISIVDTGSGILLRPHDSDFDLAMRAYGDGAQKYQRALQKLAEE